MYQAGLKRLKACMQRASHGEELVIAFLGGSITQGSLATKDENTYARRVFSWWKESFQNPGFTMSMAVLAALHPTMVYHVQLQMC